MQHSDLRMTRRALMAAASAGLLAAPARAATEWQLFTSQNRTAPIALGVLERLLAEAPARTNNALTIELKTAGTLPIRSTAVADAVAAGKVQLGDDTYFPAVLPPGGMLRMPGLVLNADELQEVLPIQQEYLTAAFAKLKIVVLGYYVSAPQIIFSSRKVLSIEDRNPAFMKSGM